VRAGLDPARFTVRTAPALLARTKPWQDYAQAARSLRAAIEKFTRVGRSSAPRAPRAPRARGNGRRGTEKAGISART
jgi:hypothetical protein